MLSNVNIFLISRNFQLRVPNCIAGNENDLKKCVTMILTKNVDIEFSVLSVLEQEILQSNSDYIRLRRNM